MQEPWLLVEPLCTCMHEALVLGLSLAERLIQQVLACLHHLITLALEHPPQNTGTVSTEGGDELADVAHGGARKTLTPMHYRFLSLI